MQNKLLFNRYVPLYTEIPIGAVLRTEYYRYLYFQEDGRVLYALSCSPPKDMFRRLLNVILHKEDDPVIVWGTFQVQKYNCTIVAKQRWHEVRFDTTIIPTSASGRFAALSIDYHSTSVSGCFDDWSHDLVEYKVPDKQFRFIKDARL
jgi:F-box protein 9